LALSADDASVPGTYVSIKKGALIPMSKAIQRALLTITLLAITACSGDVTGTYMDDGELTAYRFQRDGRATISVLGTTVPAEYTIDGDRILVTSAQGTVVLKQSGDRLYGPMGLELKRQTD
jgi:hypothetical protein